MGRDQVVRALREIAALLRIRGESEFRVRAYEAGAARIAQLQGDLRALVREGRLTELPGIGAGLAATITELVETGRTKLLDELRTDFPPGIVELLEVPSLGPRRAMRLWKELEIGTVDELARAAHEGKLRGLRGFGPKSEAKLLEEIDRLRAAPPAPERRLLGHALPAAEAVLERLAGTTELVRGSLAGEVRRFRDEVDDCAVVVSTGQPGKVLDAAARLPEVARELQRPEPERSVLRLFDHDVRLELTAVPDEAFATTLLERTGSPAHFQHLVALAGRRQLSLSGRGLFHGTRRIATPDEASVYAALDLDFVPPELREDQGELDAAEHGEVPELVRVEDIRGIVHSHSTWSDGADPLEAMARGAQALGLRYLTVTEHSPTASYAGGVKVDELQRLWDEIDALNERLDGFRLLKGVESDILPDGALDYPDRLLERLEVVVGSIHARHQMDEDAMTRRILGALENPHLNILGHLTGRLLQRREPYALRVEEIFARAAERGVAIEVNGNPHRLDIDAGKVKRALALGVKLVCSTDSHSVRELRHVRYAVGTARRGGARPEDVLNTLDAGAFLRALRQLKRNGRPHGPGAATHR